VVERNITGEEKGRSFLCTREERQLTEKGTTEKEGGMRGGKGSPNFLKSVKRHLSRVKVFLT